MRKLAGRRLPSTVTGVCIVATVCGALLTGAAPIRGRMPGEALNEMQIDAGRLDAIMRNVESGLENSAASPARTAVEQRRDIDDELVEAVVRYNANTVRACRRRIVAAYYCSGPWTPAWLYQPEAGNRSEAELRSMIAETEARVAPFWRALCEGHKSGPGLYPMCEME